MKELNLNKESLQGVFGIIGYFERENAPSVDVLLYSRTDKIVVGLYQQEEVYEVQVFGEYPNKYFDLGVERFYFRNMKEVE